MSGQQGITGQLWAHRVVAQDEMRQDREHRATCGALEPPDRDPAQPDADIMRVARQAPAAVTRRLVCELQTEGQEKGEHTFDKRLAIAKQLKVGRFMLEINGEGAVFAGLASGVKHGSSFGQIVSAANDPR